MGKKEKTEGRWGWDFLTISIWCAVTTPRPKPAHISRKASICQLPWMYHLPNRGASAEPSGYRMAMTMAIMTPCAASTRELYEGPESAAAPPPSEDAFAPAVTPGLVAKGSLSAPILACVRSSSNCDVSSC